MKQKKLIIHPSTLLLFLLFYSPKPRSQVRILIYRKWSIIPKSYLFGTLRKHIRRVWSNHGSYFGETPDMPPKRTKKALLGIYRTQIFSPKFSVTVIKSARRYTEWPARRIIRVNKRHFGFGGKDFCAFFRLQNIS